MKKINLEQGSQEWLEYRKGKFNASETSALFGCGFVSKLELAKIKFENKEQFISEKMKAGNEAENMIREIARNITGEYFSPCVCVWEQDERFSASLDGINSKGDTILECKYSQNELEQLQNHNEPSEKYYLQVQHQLMVSGAKMCVFIVMNDYGEYEFCYVYPNLKNFDEIIEAWEQFIIDYENGNLDYEIPAELESKCDELRGVMERIRELQTQEKLLKEMIKDEIIAKYGEIDRAGGYGVTISKVTTKKQDYKGFLKSQNLTVSDDFISESVSYRVGVK